MFILVRVGCIECGEPSKLIGVYPTREAAGSAARSYLEHRDVGYGWATKESFFQRLVTEGVAGFWETGDNNMYLWEVNNISGIG